MKKLLLLSMFIFQVSCNDGNASKLDALRKNIAKENAMIAYPEAKCDEIGFEEPTLHSVRCTLKNGVRLYCTAGIGGTSCNPIYAPEEVVKAAQADAKAKADAEAAKATEPTVKDKKLK